MAKTVADDLVTAIQRAGYVRVQADDATVERLARALAVDEDNGCFLPDGDADRMIGNERESFRRKARAFLAALTPRSDQAARRFNHANTDL